jgi:hypothetical protein
VLVLLHIDAARLVKNRHKGGPDGDQWAPQSRPECLAGGIIIGPGDPPVGSRGTRRAGENTYSVPGQSASRSGNAGQTESRAERVDGWLIFPAPPGERTATRSRRAIDVWLRQAGSSRRGFARTALPSLAGPIVTGGPMRPARARSKRPLQRAALAACLIRTNPTTGQGSPRNVGGKC